MNKDGSLKKEKPVFVSPNYKKFEASQYRKLNKEEIRKYLLEKY